MYLEKNKSILRKEYISYKRKKHQKTSLLRKENISYKRRKPQNASVLRKRIHQLYEKKTSENMSTKIKNTSVLRKECISSKK